MPLLKEEKGVDETNKKRKMIFLLMLKKLKKLLERRPRKNLIPLQE